MSALWPSRAIAQVQAAAPITKTTTPEPVLGIAMGTNRRGLHDYLSARGWTTVTDSMAGVGNPSLHAGTIAGRPAEIIGMFGESGRLVNLAMNLPATSEKDLREAYVAVYRLLEQARCAPTLQPEYASQRDSILRGTVSRLPSAPSGRVYPPLLAGHTTVAPDENTDWPHPTWANRDAMIGTQLSAVRLGVSSRWPFQVTVWSASYLMLGQPTMCADSRAALEVGMRAMRAEQSASRPVKVGNGPDSIVVEAGPGTIIRLDTLVVRGTEGEPDGVRRVLMRPRGSRLHYEVQPAAGYDSVDVVVGDSLAPRSGTLIVDGESAIGALGHEKPRPETNRLYELMRAELVSKNPLAAFVAVECEMERLTTAYPRTAERWIAQASERAHNPERDRKAIRRMEDALNGHEFEGCERDRVHYGTAP